MTEMEIEAQKFLDIYAHRNGADVGFTMPVNDLQFAENTSCIIGRFIATYLEYCEDPLAALANYPWAKTFIMGFPIPDFQRPLVWSDDQYSAFIDSIFREYELGGVLLNGYKHEKPTKSQMVKFSDSIIDGQHRLYAIQKFLLNDISTVDATGTPRRYGELSITDRRRFATTTINLSIVHCFEEDKIKAIYNRRNFSGVAHKPEDAAIYAP